MPAAPNPSPQTICRRCGLLQRVDPAPRGFRARCCRCRVPIALSPGRAAERAAAFALAALCLYPAALLLPVIRIERFGHSRSATIWTGAVDLIREGEMGVGLLVFTCSIVVPLLKVGGIFAISAGGKVLAQRSRDLTHRAIDWIGRWGMLDVLLVAVLVASVKLGNWADVHPGPGLAAFAGVVVLSLLASASFDPAAIWEHSS